MSSYIIVRSPSAVHLEELVNAKIKEGYRPTGGVCIGNDSTHKSIYVQAMSTLR